ncbi:MAG: C-terminal binding protein [Planctomycetaceae bacterium]|nr:C-terminal binding protein [Planctomycetaceae bacterium]
MSPRFRVLLTDRAWPDTSLEQKVLEAAGAEIVEPSATDEATLIAAVADVDAIATNWANITEAVLRAATRCRIVARLGIGVDNIAIPTATELRIPVTNVPDYCVSEVADHTIGLLMACARKIAFFHHRTKRGEYQLQAAGPMRRLSTQTLGLFGLGHIGSAVAARAKSLELNVIAHTASGSDHGTGCRMVSFEELLANSDFVSLHAPLTDATRQRFNAESLGRMKRTAHLINTSRGGLVDEAALWTALQQGRLAGAALDVFDPEPPDLAQPLFQDERVIVTPHAAFVSEESLAQMRTQALEGIAAVLSGRRPQNVLNPQIYTAAE